MEEFSQTRKKRLEIQGFRGYTHKQYSQFAGGLRFAYLLCGTIVLIGLFLQNLYLLGFALVIAILGSFLPRNPLDYLYNFAVHTINKKPMLPYRTKQANFARFMASVFLGFIIYFFVIGLVFWAYVLGIILLISAFLVSVYDISIPSMVYNWLFERKKR